MIPRFEPLMPKPKNKEISQLSKQTLWPYCKMIFNLGLSPVDFVLYQNCELFHKNIVKYEGNDP